MMPSTQGHCKGHLWFDRLQRWSRDTTLTGNGLRIVVRRAQHPVDPNARHIHNRTSSRDYHGISKAVQKDTTLYLQLFPVTHDIRIPFNQKLGPIQAFPRLGLQANLGLRWYEQLKYGSISNTTELLESHTLQPSTFGIIRMNTWRDRVRVRLNSVHCYIKKVMEGNGRSWKVSEGSEISCRAE